MSDELPPVPEGLPAPSNPDVPVVLYTTPWCGYCRAALALLAARKIGHVQVDVQGNTSARRWLATATGQTTVPQVFIRGKSIGGYSELAELDDDGTLASLIQ